MKKIVVAFLVTLSSLFAQLDLSNASLYKADIDSKTAYEMQQKGALIIDVRTQREFEFSRPKDAINIPVFYEKSGQRVFNQDFVEQVDYALKGNHDKEVILICRSGSRTKFASNLLANEGFSNVYNIQQGFTYDWAKTELPVEK
ncbi:MAG: rhodanese-like domain-containing protein [Arcobacteraceae bacterium]